MSPETIALVRASFARFAAEAERFSGDFYRRLFALDPNAQAMFPHDMKAQGAKFMGMLESIVDALESPDRLHEMFAAMGERHAGYGVTEANYDDVGVALLTSVKAALGEDWNADIEEAWATVYGEIAETMIASARGADAPSG